VICSILIGLDGSESDIEAEELGIRWARRFEARLTGIAIVDDPGIQFTGDGVIKRSVRETVVASFAAQTQGPFRTALIAFCKRCRDAGVPAQALEAAGSPHSEILFEAQRHDVILMGSRSHFDYGWEGSPGHTLGLVLKDCSRPVVAVPDGLRYPFPEPNSVRPVAVAYDGSLQAARTLFAFQESGLGQGRPIHVISIDPDLDKATSLADRAIDFLRVHDHEVLGRPRATTRPPAEVILELVDDLDAELLVMGAYGQPTLREFFIGSVTRSILEKCPTPVFCYH
jgi:nucleotide-binding universal stress UspA family protein